MWKLLLFRLIEEFGDDLLDALKSRLSAAPQAMSQAESAATADEEAEVRSIVEEMRRVREST